MSLLKIDSLRVRFRTRKGEIDGVQGVSLRLEAGKTLALVGESGSGKSVTAMSILQLLDENGYIAGGEILFGEAGEEVDLARLSKEKMQKVRGNQISVVFQENAQKTTFFQCSTLFVFNKFCEFNLVVIFDYIKLF